MILLLTSVSMFVAVVVMLGYVARRIRAYRSVPTVDRLPDRPLDTVSIIVPARNEEASIARCLRGLLAQRYPQDALEVIVVDDNSTDRTADIVRGFSSEHPNLQLIAAGELPGGWKGKPHACWQGAKVAKGAWLCFMDSDTSAQPTLTASALTYAQAEEIDLLSLQPFQESGTFWERLIIPLGFLGLIFRIDLKQINDPRARRGAANGQFILLRRPAYDAVDGHQGVRDEIVEDVALGDAVKKAGYRIQLMGGEALISTRMYRSFREIWEGLTKNAALVFGGAPQALAQSLLIVLGALSPWVVPGIALRSMILSGGGQLPAAALIFSGLALVLMLLFHASLYQYFRVSPLFALLFPLGYLLLDAILLASVWRKLTGRLSWKGRVYAS